MASHDKIEFILEGLTCSGCAAKIAEAIEKLAAVKTAVIDLPGQRLLIEVSDTNQTEQIISQARAIVQRIEPDVIVREKAAPTPPEPAPAKKIGPAQICLFGGAALFALNLLLGLEQPYGLLLYLGSYLLVGGQVLWRALKNISRGQIFDENFLMSVASIGAFAIGEYPEGVAVMLFYQVGEAFQELAVRRSRRSIAQLMDIRPDFANLKTAHGPQRVRPEQVKPGDIIVVKPGERIPLDGVVVEGQAALDTSALTGEALPRDVEPGSEVLSGSINQNGLLTIRVSREFGESTVAKILDLVQNAGSKKSHTENFITKFARYYTPLVVCGALALALLPPLFIPGAVFSDWLQRGLIFLVVSCPCALVISIPLSFFGGIGGASRNGVLIKGGNHLEALNQVDTIVFDKTGTLTRGDFQVTEIKPAPGFSEEQVLAYAAAAESNSNHPIALSIRQAYGRDIATEDIFDYQELAGQGVAISLAGQRVLAGNSKLMATAQLDYEPAQAGGTVVYLAVEGRYAGHLIISDQLKPDSKQAIAGLRALGVRRIAMLSGDSRDIAEKIGAELGLDQVYAELLPQQKVEQLEKLEQEKTGLGKLVFVGDGINDAPVLARSDLGIAMGGLGSDAAIEAADVVLMTDEPLKIVTAIKIAKKTRRIVWQNISLALGVKGLVLVLGAAGMVSMWAAVFADVGVAIMAILNAIRAMRIA